METTNNTAFETHTFASFLSKYHVIIPMVQRDYAQGRTSNDVNRIRNRFLDAIHACLIQPVPNTMKMDFVYGETENIWSKTEAQKLERIDVTPLDGQQRLTTLYLLHWFAAKKENVDSQSYAFLRNFTYDIRPSSRDFCSHIMDFVPTLDSSIQDQIIDQNWFMGDWHNDPTIKSMLVMIDAIKEKFSEVNNLWNLLTNENRIIFYFLPLSENGLSDELYIKMNSRGKKLTDFEHFKAEYEDLYETDSKESITINHKFDVEWADIFFPYRGRDQIFDDEFMRYFFYISHILCYEQSIKKSNDEFVLIKSLYKDSSKAEENKRFFERALDCWYSVMQEYGNIEAFFDKYLSQSKYEKEKVATYKTIPEYTFSSDRKTQNFFLACIKLYQVNNNFSYGDFLFLYGIITYLLNKEKIAEEDFITRLRILRNLIWNSNSGEIRGDADYMRDLLGEVVGLIMNGIINKELKHRFNGFQEDEEIEKMSLSLSPENREMMKKFEDHPFIYGYVKGLGYDYLNYTDAFYTLFATPNLLDVHRAMIAIGDYKQKDSNRYYMGNWNRSTWIQLLHKSRNRSHFEEKTMTVLRALLNRIKNGESIDGVIEDYTQNQEAQSKYPWRYYFAKYPDMLRGADGELTWDSNDYICTTLNKHQFNGQHWNPFLNVLYIKLKDVLKAKYSTKILSFDNYGGNLNLLHPIASISLVGNGFKYFYQDEYEDWLVPQDADGIDTEDRILFAIGKIKEIVKRHYASQA